MPEVFKLLVYYTAKNDEVMEPLRRLMQSWFPHHSPILTAIGIEKLAFEGMRIEIEAWEHLG